MRANAFLTASFAFSFTLILLGSPLGLSARAAPPLDKNDCRTLMDNETPLDCPWAGITRALANPTVRLEDQAPELARALAQEAKKLRRGKQLWGRSLNFDENVKATIIPEPIIDTILARGGVAPRGQGVKTELAPQVVHAGFEHTYGYLLSNLKTPYGFKRLRWVRPDIENGFRLPTGTITPLPKDGGLLANLTYFAGRIALRGENPEERVARAILRELGNVSPALRKFDYSTLHGRRLKETLTLPNGRVVEIRFDFVPFLVAAGEATGGNSELLIYSVRDSAEKLPHLITVFPASPGFSDGLLASENLGEGKTIVTRYNLFVSGVTDAKGPFTGKREVENF